MEDAGTTAPVACETPELTSVQPNIVSEAPIPTTVPEEKKKNATKVVTDKHRKVLQPRTPHSDPAYGPANVDGVITSQPFRGDQRQPAGGGPHGDGPFDMDAENSDDDLDDLELKYGAGHVINLFVPVSLCMALVVFTMNTVQFYSKNEEKHHLLYTPFVGETTNTGERVLMSLGNAAVMLCVVVVMTTILIIFYKYRCYRVIHGWLIMSSFMLLFFFTTVYFNEVVKTLNWAPSLPSTMFFVFNFGAVGMMVIHWKGPLRLQQFYLISISALMALVFIKYLPEWTVWSVLAVISIWDLVAVLAPKGPLRVLVETAQERNEPIFPALIYSSGVLYPYTLLSMAALEDEVQSTAAGNQLGESENAGTSQACNAQSASIPTKKAKKVTRIAVPPPQLNNEHTRVEEPSRTLNGDAVRIETQRQARPTLVRREEEKGVKLGLGDFIFYSVLVGKASSYFDWNTTVACYVAILVGLCFTLVLLAVFKRALPALPISIFAGLMFYFCTRWIVTPFVSEITKRQWLF